MTKSRKRMLLSSVAMLLVALVALGSATYAWFTVSKTVTADTMKVKAIAKAGLEICNTDDGLGTYGRVASFSQNADTAYQLMPVSWNGTTADGFIPAANVTDSAAGTYNGAFKAAGDAIPDVPTADKAMAKSNGSYFAVYKVWVRSAPTAESPFTSPAHTVEAKVTISGDNATFCRVKFIDGSNSKGIFGDSSSASTTANVVAAEGTTKTTYTVLNQSNPEGQSKATFDVTGTTANAAVGTPFTFVVWFDGEDAQCFDNNKDKFADIQVEFSAKDM